MGRSHIALVLLAVCSTVAISLGAVSLPGAKVRLSQKGLDYAVKEAMNTFDIKGQHIPDQHGKAHIAHGKVDYHITETFIESFGRPASKVVVNPGKGITWSATGMSISIHGHFHYSYRKKHTGIHFKDHGSFDVQASGFDFSVSFILERDATGHPLIKSTACSSNAGSLKVKFHHGASWLYNLFKSDIAKALKGKVNTLMCQEATKLINGDAEKRLASVDLVTNVGDEMILDYSLTQAPVFSKGYMDVMLKGEFVWKKAPTQPPFQPKPFPDTTDASKMLYIWGSESVVNSFIYAAYSHQLARSNLSREDLPKGDGDFLNTTCSGISCVGSYLEKVAAKYPHSAVSIKMGATEVPYIRITPAGINFHATGNMSVYANLLSHKIYLFKIQATLDMSVTASIEGTTLKGKITSMKPSIKVLDTIVGKLTDKFLDWLLQKVSNKFIIKELNKLGEKGMVIPNIKDCKYISPVLKLNSGNLMIATDLAWTPKKKVLFNKGKEGKKTNKIMDNNIF